VRIVTWVYVVSWDLGCDLCATVFDTRVPECGRRESGYKAAAKSWADVNGCLQSFSEMAREISTAIDSRGTIPDVRAYQSQALQLTCLLSMLCILL
jgi:hypothetical protein